MGIKIVILFRLSATSRTAYESPSTIPSRSSRARDKLSTKADKSELYKSVSSANYFLEVLQRLRRRSKYDYNTRIDFLVIPALPFPMPLVRPIPPPPLASKTTMDGTFSAPTISRFSIQRTNSQMELMSSRARRIIASIFAQRFHSQHLNGKRREMYFPFLSRSLYLGCRHARRPFR